MCERRAAVGQDPDFQCAGFDPELRTSAAKSKTARPARRSWASCKIGVFLVWAYRAGLLSADCGTEHSFAAAQQQHKLRSFAWSTYISSPVSPPRTAGRELLKRGLWGLGVCSLTCRRHHAEQDPEEAWGVFIPTDATPNMGRPPVSAMGPVLSLGFWFYTVSSFDSTCTSKSIAKTTRCLCGCKSSHASSPMSLAPRHVTKTLPTSITQQMNSLQFTVVRRHSRFYIDFICSVISLPQRLLCCIAQTP
jgi:hypothetical protein